ncbi:cytochrome d ubiquinol oxidase subunit II [Bacillus solimangrovi]|uniref:Cytochrome D ubiquinol oxidase subunit II n=1 Tax=Bacillus solimangrovi TaxID=1305675 RepID=A0A1E5LHD8_9BACI|nr:cytochrome d ubiquinol oxidase subunit II [Bacillus solimangrovi]OEH93493.1 cytochrome D ubiquinol oxidase subunit II [Bacillus solimangrovi]
MTLELLGITVLGIFLFGYVIIGSIDFGAGFYSTYSDWAGKKHMIHRVIQRYLSPVWEVTNVFLVFFFVGIVGFFPKTAYYYGTALLIPGSVSIILLAIRGSYYAFSNYGAPDRKLYSVLYGITGVLIPASLTTVLTISEGGFITVEGDKVTLQLGELLTNPYSWSVVMLAFVSVLFISASFLTYYANKANDLKAQTLLRKYALLWSAPSILSALVVMYMLRFQNPIHFERMIEIGWLFVLSFICFIVAVYFIYKGIHFGWAFLAVVMQYAFAFFAYGFSHYPYLLYPYLTIYDGFTNETMAKALVVVFILGLCVLIPSLYLLMKLFLFNHDYVKGQK